MVTGREKAAQFLSILGSKYSEKILDHLPADVSDAIAGVLSEGKRKLSPAEISAIIDDFNASIYAIEFEEKEVPAPLEGEKGEVSVPPVEIITKASPDELAKALKDERPEFIAFILSHLPVERIHEVLSLLGNVRREVEEKLIHMKDVPITAVFQDQVLDIVAKRLM